jgi:antitoxin component HigA of HigAB toxin-antitoxin module
MEDAAMTPTAEKIYTARYRQLIRQFPLHRITTKRDADAATRILDVLFPKDTYEDPGEEEYVMVLADLLADYEESLEADEPEATGLDVLKLLMEAQDITQAQLGEILGVSQSGVSQILSGHRQVTADHARRLGKHFRMNPGMFL